MMNHPFFQKTKSVLAMLFILSAYTAFSQDVFEIHMDHIDGFTHLSTDVGRDIKLIASDDRLVVLDYENYRILFYQKGTDFDDLQILNIVGEHSRVQYDQPFDPDHYNRLSQEFTGTLYNDTLWITNYTYGEILLFNLDGDYIKSLSGQYRALDTHDATLYALNKKSIYRYDPLENNFTYLKELPESVRMDRDQSGTNVKIGAGRMGVKKGDSLHVYDFKDYIDGTSVSRLFSKTGEFISDFEIMTDQIIWAINYKGGYRICDLDGNEIKSGDMRDATYTYHFSESVLFYVGASFIRIYDNELNELVSISKYPFYLDLRFLGADSSQLYFYDHRDRGFVVTPLNHNEGVFEYDPDHEIPYSGWNKDFRISNDYKFLLSEWPPDSFKIYRFDTHDMSKLFFRVDEIQGFDVVKDSVYTISGKRVDVYTDDGVWCCQHRLSNLSESNLNDIDSTSIFKFAANHEKLFVGYDDKLNIFDHSGGFERMVDFQMESYAQLFASDTQVICNAPLNALDLATGHVSPFLTDSTPDIGFIFGDLYWYKAGVNLYANTSSDVVSFTPKTRSVPKQFRLLQNYPNPFNPVTIIQYKLSHPSRVRMSIYDVLGREVKTLSNCTHSAGTFEIMWDGTDNSLVPVSGGIYFCRMEAGGFIQTIKLVLVR